MSLGNPLTLNNSLDAFFRFSFETKAMNRSLLTSCDSFKLFDK